MNRKDTASGNPGLVDASVLEQVRQLELFSRFRVEGFLHALSKSPLKGFSSDFLQHRQYYPGDNLKYLDWRAYGKSERLFTKEFEEETNLRLSVLLDVSNSMTHRGASALSKHAFAIRCAAVLFHLAVLQRDSFCFAAFNVARKAYVPFGTGQQHLRRTLRALLDTQAGGGTEFPQALQESTLSLRRRGLTIVLSDFMDDPERIVPSLARLHHRGSDVIAMQVFDPSERELDFANIVRFHDLEGSQIIVVDPTVLRKQYQREFDAHQLALKQACRRSGFDHIALAVCDDYQVPLMACLRGRMELLC